MYFKVSLLLEDALVSVTCNALLALIAGRNAREANFEIRPCTERLFRARENHSADPIVPVNYLIGPYELIEEVVGYGIVLLRTVEGHDEDLGDGWRVRRNVGDFDVLERQRGVGGGGSGSSRHGEDWIRTGIRGGQ